VDRCDDVNQRAKNASSYQVKYETDRLQIYVQLFGFANFFRTGLMVRLRTSVIFRPMGLPDLFFVVSDVYPFPAKPVFDLIIATYDHESVTAVLVYELVV